MEAYQTTRVQSVNVDFLLKVKMEVSGWFLATVCTRLCCWGSSVGYTKPIQKRYGEDCDQYLYFEFVFYIMISEIIYFQLTLYTSR